jgi:hypothetical protein
LKGHHQAGDQVKRGERHPEVEVRVQHPHQACQHLTDITPKLTDSIPNTKTKSSVNFNNID